MKVFKFYDAVCDKCGNWYGANRQPPQVNNQEEAIQVMKRHGWKEKDDETLCEKCAGSTLEG